jgi:hypothetical protein
MPAGLLQHAQIFRDVSLGQPGAAADFLLDASAAGDGVNGDPLAGVVIEEEVAGVAKGNGLEAQLAVGAAASTAGRYVKFGIAALSRAESLSKRELLPRRRDQNGIGETLAH